MVDPDRSTLRLLAQLDRAEAANQVPIFSGNTSDVFIAADGDPSRLVQLLAKRASALGRVTVAHSLANGTRQLTPPGCAPAPLHLPAADAPPAQVLGHLRGQLDTAASHVQVIVDYADLSIPPTPGMVSLEFNRVVELLGEFALDPSLAARGHRLVVITRVGALDERLARLPGFVVLHVGLPDHNERLAFVRRLCQPVSGPPLSLSDDLPGEHLARLSGGLTLDDLLRGRDESQQLGPLTPAWVQARKTDSLRRLAGETLNVYEPGPGLAGVAGLPQIRRLLQEARTTGHFPRRVLLAGPPGTGKTLCVTAIADELGIPAVALGNYRSMWVGESERNLRNVLGLVQSLAPCILHIDEIDQAIGQRTTGQSADGGTSERILADLWGFLGDNLPSEWVTVVATTNRPELLDSALFDRFTILPVLHPAPQEAAQILQIAAGRQGRRLDVVDGRAVVEQFGGLLTGRILVDVVERAMVLAHLDNSPAEIRREHLQQAFADLLMALDPLEHEFLALRAIELCTFKAFLPWNAARWLGQEPHLPAYLGPLLDPGGDIDPERLRHRLGELSGGRYGIH